MQSTTDNFNILEDGSSLWKLANMNGFTSVERYWGMNDRDETFTFKLMFKDDERKFGDMMRGCVDEMRPMSTTVDIKFKFENDEDINDLSNDKIFNAIADVVEKEDVNVIAGKHMLWRKGVSKEEMLVKMDLWEASTGDENGH